MPDQWENAFNAHDPLGDADGDGVNNLTEYQNCTDPLDAASFIPSTLTLEFTRIDEVLRLEWSLALPTAILEGSDDLQDWEPITTGLTTTTSHYRYDVDPSAAGLRRYYRLKKN
jgi:hypothetical protein